MAKSKSTINTNTTTIDIVAETTTDEITLEQLETLEENVAEKSSKSKKKERKVKCPHCGAYNEKETAIRKSNKYYCSTCYDIVQAESNDYKELIAFICNLFQMDTPSILILTQIKDYKEKHKFTYKGMKTTLDYFYNLKENPLELNGRKVTTIGIIPYVYDEAKEFYSERAMLNPNFSEEIAESMENNCCYINVQIEEDDEEDNSIGYGMIDISELLEIEE